TGLEHAMRSINAAGAGEAGPWNAWIAQGTQVTRTLTGFDFGAGITGSVHVAVLNYQAAAPTIVSHGVVTFATGETVEKWLRATTGTRGLFAYGLLAKS